MDFGLRRCRYPFHDIAKIPLQTSKNRVHELVKQGKISTHLKCELDILVFENFEEIWRDRRSSAALRGDGGGRGIGTW